MYALVKVPIEVYVLAAKLYRIKDNNKFIDTLNNNIRKRDNR